MLSSTPFTLPDARMITFMKRTWQWIGRWTACLALTLIWGAALSRDASAAENCQGAVEVRVAYNVPLPEGGVRLTLTLLDDADDVLARITALQEASKPELEPLIKRYMHAAEMLSRLSQAASEQRAQFRQQFDEAETHISHILARYHQQLRRIVEHAAVASQTCAALVADCRLADVKPGQYRLLAELSFSTTTLRWFEPVEVKGGDSPVSVLLTRDNLKNPYWTDLNWWSFLNLDFSKHH